MYTINAQNHLQSVSEQSFFTAAEILCRLFCKLHHILPRLPNTEITNTMMFAMQLSNYMQLKLQHLFRENLHFLKYSLILILISLFRVIRYRLKFLKNDRFDNRFITADFRKIDLQRVKNDQETVLPLNRREDKMYITVILTDTINYCYNVATHNEYVKSGSNLLTPNKLQPISIQEWTKFKNCF